MKTSQNLIILGCIVLFASCQKWGKEVQFEEKFESSEGWELTTLEESNTSSETPELTALIDGEQLILESDQRTDCGLARARYDFSDQMQEGKLKNVTLNLEGLNFNGNPSPPMRVRVEIEQYIVTFLISDAEDAQVSLTADLQDPYGTQENITIDAGEFSGSIDVNDRNDDIAPANIAFLVRACGADQNVSQTMNLEGFELIVR